MIKKLAFVLISAFLMGIVLTGCTPSETPPQTLPQTPAAAPVYTPPAAPPQAPAAPEVQTETISAVQTFLDEYGEDIRAEFGELSVLLGEGANIDIVAGDGEEFIFIFAYGPDADTDAFAATLEAVMPLMGSMFDIFAIQLQEELGVDTLTITVRYEDYDGNVLAEESFVASQ